MYVYTGCTNMHEMNVIEIVSKTTMYLSVVTLLAMYWSKLRRQVRAMEKTPHSGSQRISEIMFLTLAYV
jgi:hypothetical protein